MADSVKDAKTGLLTWGLGVFHTLSDDDIIQVASPLGVNNFGFFQNAGNTLRQGIEAKIDYRDDRWNAYANYTFVDATYQSEITLFSPNNPNALTDPNTGRPVRQRQAGRPYPGHSGPPLQGWRRIFRDRCVEGWRRPQLRG